MPISVLFVSDSMGSASQCAFSMPKCQVKSPKITAGTAGKWKSQKMSKNDKINFFKVPVVPSCGCSVNKQLKSISGAL